MKQSVKFITALSCSIVFIGILTKIFTVPVGDDPAGTFLIHETDNLTANKQDIQNFDSVIQSEPEFKYLPVKHGSLTKELDIDLSKLSCIQEPEESESDQYEVSFYEYSTEDCFQDELSLIPDWHYDLLIENGWSFILTDIDLADEYGYDVSIAGLTLYDEKIIYVADRMSAIERATIHEAGHALSYEYGRLDLSQEFIDIYNLEKYNFNDITSIGDGHEIESSTEYFASVYQNMVLNYTETYNDVPLTVEYIERYLW